MGPFWVCGVAWGLAPSVVLDVEPSPSWRPAQVDERVTVAVDPACLACPGV